MNSVVIVGRITKDPEIRYSQGENATAFGQYSIAVDRPVGKGKDPITDFINCKVVGKSAEFAEKYLSKGMKIAIEGRIQVDSYKDKDGNNRQSTYVQVTSHEFCEKRGDAHKEVDNTDADGFMKIAVELEEELPFN